MYPTEQQTLHECQKNLKGASKHIEILLEENAMLREALNARQEVIWFAGEMEGQLKANDHKGGWYNCSLTWLVTKLTEEVGEVAKIITEHGSYGGVHKRELVKEAADVANIAMMIADAARKAIGVQEEQTTVEHLNKFHGTDIK